MSRSSGNLESCHRQDRQTVLPQQTLKPEHLQAEYGMNGEKGRTGAAKRLWEIVRRLWGLVRLYWHTGSTPAPNSYCTPTLPPTSLSATDRGLDQCWAVLTFVRTGQFRFLHYVVTTWSLFESIYMCVFGLVRTEQVLKFIFFKLNRFSNMVILASIITIDFPIQFYNSVFILFRN
jgi:hypothetical protein